MKKKYTAIGFQNSEGGWELRNGHFQAASSPKASTFLDNRNESLLKVFEGFFDFLSYQTLFREGKLPKEASTKEPDYLILNSLSFFQKSRPLMEKSGKTYTEELYRAKKENNVLNVLLKPAKDDMTQPQTLLPKKRKKKRNRTL